MTRAILVLVASLTAQAAMAQSGRTLDIYFIDVEGGQATLIVTPAGETFLVDSGWSGGNGRDAKRIMAAAHEAGISQIDYLLITHFHSDHDGGVPELAKQIPIRTFMDYGEATEKGGKVQDPFEAYVRVRKKGTHLEPKIGDKIPLKGLDVQFVSGRKKTLTEALPGGGQDNPACTAFKKKANDFTENAKSFGFRLVYGKFTFLDVGDLVWNELGQLVCPKNLIGPVDVYLVAHHGNAFSGVPAFTDAIRPRVAIMNNGEAKGGDAKTFKVLSTSPGLETLWQLHKVTDTKAKQTPDQFIANLDQTSSYRLKLSASEDGAFSITNPRTSFTKHYDAK